MNPGLATLEVRAAVPGLMRVKTLEGDHTGDRGELALTDRYILCHCYSLFGKWVFGAFVRKSRDSMRGVQ